MRRTELKRKPRRSEPREQGAIVWARAARLGRCAVCNRQAHHGHHIITKQELRRRGAAELLWDLRNMLPVCADCHARHHHAFRRIRRRELPAAAFEFAAELGLEWLIERTYPV